MQTNAWVIAAASVAGLGHVQNNIVCQDAHGYCLLDNDWGLAVISDGAGSRENSHIGSQKTVEFALKRFEELAYQADWVTKNNLPDKVTWNEKALSTLKAIRDELAAFAQENNYEFASLACTLIVALFSPNGILITHIGDGRGAVKFERWTNLMIPYKGEEASETVFITTPFIWDDTSAYIECWVCTGSVQALAILSDGCENGSFLCRVFDENENKFNDPNLPYEPFFEPNAQTLIKLTEMGKTQEEINAIWENYLKQGNAKFKSETDDKTIILIAKR